MAQLAHPDTLSYGSRLKESSEYDAARYIKLFNHENIETEI